MAVTLADDPPQLVRIGRSPDPLAWPPLAFTGLGRYDDPDLTVSTLYASVDRRTAFLETLDAFRPNLSLLARIGEAPDQFGWQAPLDTSGPGVRGTIPVPYFDRLIAEFHVAPGQRWLDLRTPESSEALRVPLANDFSAQVSRVDSSTAIFWEMITTLRGYSLRGLSSTNSTESHTRAVMTRTGHAGRSSAMPASPRSRQ